MAFRMRMRKGVNIPRVVTKIFGTVIALWVGGTVMQSLGTVMKCSSSPFYNGLTLIGWTVTSSTVPTNSNLCNATGEVADRTATYYNIITSTTGTGVLAVVGIIGIGAVVLEFVQFSW